MRGFPSAIFCKTYDKIVDFCRYLLQSRRVREGVGVPVSFLTAVQRESYGRFAVVPTPEEIARFCR
jgi:hypothetical protein